MEEIKSKVTNAIIDRFEGGYAVVELDDKSMKNIPIRLFKDKVIEGDCIKIQQKDNKIEITIDKERTLERKEKINDILKDLFI